MNNSEVNNKHINKDGKLKTILSIWYFQRKIFPYVRLVKHNSILCAHGGMQQWGVKYRETYTAVVNQISVRSLLDIAIIHEFTSRPIDFVLDFNKADIYADAFMGSNLGIRVDGNR